MVRIYRVQETDAVERAGYSANYYANLMFRNHLNSAGFIFVNIPKSITTEPHVHQTLEEVFVALTPLSMLINGQLIDLNVGDLIFVEPGEYHSIRTNPEIDGQLLAIKFPNLTDDKVSISN